MNRSKLFCMQLIHPYSDDDKLSISFLIPNTFILNFNGLIIGLLWLCLTDSWVNAVNCEKYDLVQCHIFFFVFFVFSYFSAREAFRASSS